MSPIGLTFEVLYVEENRGERSTCLVARREGFYENPVGLDVLRHTYDEVCCISLNEFLVPLFVHVSLPLESLFQQKVAF